MNNPKLIPLLIILLLPLTTALPHAQYDSFSSVEERLSLSGSSLSVTDDAVYRIGYYSMNGATWVPFTLTGNNYQGSNDWLSGSASYSLPASLSGIGEHYIIVFSCSLANNAWDCHPTTGRPEGYWQLLVIGKPVIIDTSCGVCDIGFTCVENVCTFSGPGELYYVAVNGDDSNSGTISEPWASLQHAVNVAVPGDVVYIRGGTYYMNSTIGGNPSEGRGASGTAAAPIRFLNYPGERPIFDWDGYLPSNSRWNVGMSWTNVEHIHLRGFTVRNVQQPMPDFSLQGEQYGTAHGIGCVTCANMFYENLVVHDVDGRAFQHWTGAWSDIDAQYSIDSGYRDNYMEPVFSSDNTKWLNCDAYNLYDRYSESPGNHADGWKVGTTFGNTFTWEGCRAWNYSDDGFDPHGSGTRIFNRCLAMSTKNFKGISEQWASEMNGYKMTAALLNVSPGYVLGETHLVYMLHSLALDAGWTGFYNNIGSNYPNHVPNNGVFYNNLAYSNHIGITDAGNGIYRNNIVHGSEATEPCGNAYHVLLRQEYTESHNTWMQNTSACPKWSYNPQYDVTDNDFVSLDMSLMIATRNDDFTMPVVDFGRLAPDSELIDGGTIIPGYHCDSSGLHPDKDCVEWAGSAPDLGPFEHGLEQEIVCRGPTTRPCSSGTGIGQQSRTCIGPGSWSGWSACVFVGCDDGYVLKDSACVIGPGWSRELLYNGGFENGIAGWVTSSVHWGSAPYSIYGSVRTPHSGYYVAHVSKNSVPSGFIYQDVDLERYAAHIDTNTVVLNASGWAISPSIYASQNAIRFLFLDASKNIISTALDTGYVVNPAWWKASVTEEPVPVGTRHVRVWANSHDVYNLDYLASGDLDSFSLKVNVQED